MNVRVYCPAMDTLPTSWLTPWLRKTVELDCTVTINGVDLAGGVTFPECYVRWTPWGINVDAGKAVGPRMVIDFPAEPVERIDKDTMRVLPVPVTGLVFLDSVGHPITGMTLPECIARRDPKRAGVFIVDSVVLVGTI